MPVNVHCDGPDCDGQAPIQDSATLHRWFTIDSAHERWYFDSGWCIARWAAAWANLPNNSTLSADGADGVTPGSATWIEIHDDCDPEEDPHGS